MKLSFPLAEYENFFSDEAIEVAESYRNDGKIIQLKEIEKKLWIAKYEELAQVYEIEVQLTGKKVKDFACDCDQPKKDCRHAYFALEALSAHFESLEEAKVKKSDEKKKIIAQKPQTLRTIVLNADPEELKKFMLDLATQNKNVEMAVRARFSLDGSGQNIEAASKELFAKLLAKAHTAYGEIKIKGWEQLTAFLDGIKFKIDNCVQNGSTSNALEFWYCYATFVLRLHRSDWDMGRRLAKRLAFSFELLKQFDEQVVAPELKEKFHNYVFDIVKTFYKVEATQSFIQYGFQHSFFNPDQIKDLLEEIEDAIKKRTSYYEEHQYLEVLQIIILQFLREFKQAKKILVNNKKNSNLYVNAIYNLVINNAFEEAKDLLREGYFLYPEPLIRAQLLRFELQIAERTQDTVLSVSTAVKLLQTTYEPRYLDILIANNVEPHVYENLIKTLESKTNDNAVRIALTAVFIKLNKFDEALALIKKTRSLDLIEQFGLLLYEHDPIKTKEICNLVLKIYMNTYTGSMPIERVYYMFAKLKSDNGDEFVNALLQPLLVEFKSRYYLKQRLGHFSTSV